MSDVNQTPNEQVMEAWQDVLSDVGDCNWMCANLSKAGELSLVGKGNQGAFDLLCLPGSATVHVRIFNA